MAPHIYLRDLVKDDFDSATYSIAARVPQADGPKTTEQHKIKKQDACLEVLDDACSDTDYDVGYLRSKTCCFSHIGFTQIAY